MPRYCIEPNCRKRSNFNKEGMKTAIYCALHKKDGMVDVKNKTCIEPDCRKRSNFNKEGMKKALYCALHKKDGMVDVKNKTCIEPDCRKQPNFNKEGMKTAIYCSLHKKDGMVDVKNKTCKSIWCLTRVNNNKYEGYCVFCYMNLFPDKPVSRNYKTKEYTIVDFVKTNFPNLDWVSDKIISGGCSRRRPDMLLDLLDQVIIIEVDENQHIDYDCTCENKRIMELSQDIGHRPVVFIRFNPDDYNKDGQNITSCWTHNKNGLCVVKKSKKDEWSHRLAMLEEQIKYWTNPINRTNKTVEIVQLFYDM